MTVVDYFFYGDQSGRERGSGAGGGRRVGGGGLECKEYYLLARLMQFCRSVLPRLISNQSTGILLRQ